MLEASERTVMPDTEARYILGANLRKHDRTYLSNIFGNTPLSGARIWLSGSIPEDEGTTEEQRTTLLDRV